MLLSLQDHLQRHRADPRQLQYLPQLAVPLLPQQYADKIKGLKELYAFMMLLKAKVAAYDSWERYASSEDCKRAA